MLISGKNFSMYYIGCTKYAFEKGAIYFYLFLSFCYTVQKTQLMMVAKNNAILSQLSTTNVCSKKLGQH